jgi:glycerate-2-kinase
MAIYDAAVIGVEPRRCLLRALQSTPPPERVRIFALGKAALPMAAAAVEHLDRLEVLLAGGVVVTPDEGESPDRRLLRLVGDHPLPGTRSIEAARAVAEAAALSGPKDEAWVLLSGGTTSLIGAPIDGIGDEEYTRLIAALGRAGLAIGDLNRLRKRFSRFGAGRLATVCRAKRIRVFALSDVPGDAPADIGSGPCEPDPSTATELRPLLDRVAGRVDLPEIAGRLLDRVSAGELPETPKPGDPSFDRVTTRIIGSNAMALAHGAERAAALGYRVVPVAALVTGEATAAGAALVARAMAERVGPSDPIAVVAGGETTVSLGAVHGVGGRCQELALAAARELAPTGGEPPLVLLAAGTDGRDGPTDAAGALVDASTWATIAARDVDPSRALSEHDAYPALAAAGALVRPGLTGTNVMDMMVVLRGW